ncbi:MAG: SpoIIE family protein phosphatase [Alphaproteobacteria bacterium]|nr:SpoIIE family protein phosphatase [Alphaproteobacteria bacterium]
MLLKTRISVLFAITFLLIAAALVVQSQLARDEIKRAVVTELSLGQSVIWDKILRSTYDSMSFYAYDSKPGTASIWALRGSRSAIAAVKTGDSRKINRALTKFYGALVESNVLDVLAIYDAEGALIHVMDAEQPVDERTIAELSGLTGVTLAAKLDGGLGVIDNRFAAHVSFPIYANARPIGSVLYARWLTPLLDEFSRAAEADIRVSAPSISEQTETQTSWSGIETLFDKTASAGTSAGQVGDNTGLDTVLLDGVTFSLNVRTLTIPPDLPVTIVMVRNVSASLASYQQIFVYVALSIAGVFALIGAASYLTLLRGFRPLDDTIAALNALAAGNTDVEVAVGRRDEVGRIAATVVSFRETILNFARLRRSAQENRLRQERTVIDETIKLAGLLPEEVRADLLADVHKMEQLKSRPQQQSDNVFEGDDESAMKLLGMAFGRISKEIKTQYEKLDFLVDERTRKIAETQAELEDKHKNLIASLNYASRIQASILPSSDDMQTVFPGCYVAWEPQHIVGGDAYLLRRINTGKDDERAVLAVYDCTGHGVPGAFMTLLGARALDAGIEADARAPQPRIGSVLDAADAFIRREVNADGNAASNDGMDCFILDYRKTGDSSYASANFTVFAQRGEEIFEIDNDLGSIGYRLQEEDAVPAFETRPITLSDYDNLVIVSDGILDQIGGPKRLSLGRRRLLRMISDAITPQDNSGQTGGDQTGGDKTAGTHINGSALRESIHQYQGENEQRDDMTLVILPCGALPA